MGLTWFNHTSAGTATTTASHLQKNRNPNQHQIGTKATFFPRRILITKYQSVIEMSYGIYLGMVRVMLCHHGYTHPRCVVDLENCFYMIGQHHICPQCRNQKTNKHSVTSWDPQILVMLPTNLAAEFPTNLSHQGAISMDVFGLM
jgi:hypothetical protein